jgi:hypothetical protein
MKVFKSLLVILVFTGFLHGMVPMVRLVFSGGCEESDEVESDEDSAVEGGTSIRSTNTCRVAFAQRCAAKL